MKNLKSLMRVFIVLLLAGCSKTTVIIDREGQNNNQPENNGGSTLVTFNAAIENRVTTRAMSLMQQGILNQLFAFDDASSSSATVTPAAQGVYITSAPGVLTGYSGYKMYLPQGVYNFYGVSDNMSSLPIRFTSGESEPLFNGIDYLWWNSPDQDITSTQITIPIVYTHAASQLVFDVSEGNGIDIDKLLFAHITPPAPGAAMDLLSGVIPPATTYDTAIDKMGINGFRAQYIVLPLKTTQPMTLSIEVQLAGQTATRTYSVSVPVPDGELKAGNSYLFEVIVNATSVEFSQVSIKDWTEVDETGNPLYPK